jgi:Tol biopolymer transport system component
MQNGTGRLSFARPLAVLFVTSSITLGGCGKDSAAPSASTQPQPPLPPIPQYQGQIEGRIAFVSTRDGEPYIYVTDTIGNGVTRLTKGERPAWSWDGRRIAFHRGFGRTADIYVINVDGTGERLLAHDGMHPSWSPDDSRIVFQGTLVSNSLFIARTDGSRVTRLASEPFANLTCTCYPTWSPDGRNIAFANQGFNGYRFVAITDTSGTVVRALYADDWSLGEPAWAPDGSSLLVEFDMGITIVGHDLSFASPRFPPIARFGLNPDWSPDGKRILFHSFANPTSEATHPLRIFVAPLDGGEVQQLIRDAERPANPGYADSDAAWSRTRK